MMAAQAKKLEFEQERDRARLFKNRWGARPKEKEELEREFVLRTPGGVSRSSDQQEKPSREWTDAVPKKVQAECRNKDADEREMMEQEDFVSRRRQTWEVLMSFSSTAPDVDGTSPAEAQASREQRHQRSRRKVMGPTSSPSHSKDDFD